MEPRDRGWGARYLLFIYKGKTKGRTLERDRAPRRVRIGCRDITAGAIASCSVSGGEESGGEDGRERSLPAVRRGPGRSLRGPNLS